MGSEAGEGDAARRDRGRGRAAVFSRAKPLFRRYDFPSPHYPFRGRAVVDVEQHGLEAETLPTEYGFVNSCATSVSLGNKGTGDGADEMGYMMGVASDFYLNGNEFTGAAVSSNRSSDYYCYHRPYEPVPGKVRGKDAADTTGFENRERSVSRLIHCMYLRVNFGGIRRLIPVVFVWLFGGMHETKIFAPIISSFARPTSCFFFLPAAYRRKRFSSIIQG